MIVVAGHVGNNEAVAAALAGAGYPRTGSRTTRRSRSCSSCSAASARRGASGSSRGATCASCSGCSGAKEIVALLVDWGYRADGVPVRLFGCVDHAARRPGRRWPPRPARSSPRSRSGGRRPGTFRVEGYEPFTVPSSGPRGHPARDAAHRGLPRGGRGRRARAVVQLQGACGPRRRTEARELEARAAAMLAGRHDARAVPAAVGPGRCHGAVRRDRHRRRTPTPAGRRAAPRAGRLAARRRGDDRREAPGRTAHRRGGRERRAVVPDRAREAGAGPREPAARVRRPRGDRPRLHARPPRGDGPRRARATRPCLLPARRPLLRRGRPHGQLRPAGRARQPWTSSRRTRCGRRSRAAP